MDNRGVDFNWALIHGHVGISVLASGRLRLPFFVWRLRVLLAGLCALPLLNTPRQRVDLCIFTRVSWKLRPDDLLWLCPQKYLCPYGKVLDKELVAAVHVVWFFQGVCVSPESRWCLGGQFRVNVVETAGVSTKCS